MPTYEYRCRDCKEVYVLSKNVDERDDRVECVCGSELRRVYNVPAIKFNGTGFYSTGG
jgi:putative FmdB family regulatory protein